MLSFAACERQLDYIYIYIYTYIYITIYVYTPEDSHIFFGAYASSVQECIRSMQRSMMPATALLNLCIPPPDEEDRPELFAASKRENLRTFPESRSHRCPKFPLLAG